MLLLCKAFYWLSQYFCLYRYFLHFYFFLFFSLACIELTTYEHFPLAICRCGLHCAIAESKNRISPTSQRRRYSLVTLSLTSVSSLSRCSVAFLSFSMYYDEGSLRGSEEFYLFYLSNFCLCLLSCFFQSACPWALLML